MKRSLLHLAIQVALKSVFALGIIGQWAKTAFMGIGRAFSWVLTPGILFFYLKGRKAKQQIATQMAPLKRRRRLYTLSHRYFVHLLLAMMVLFVSIPSFSSANTTPGSFGEGTLLKELVGGSELTGEEEIVIDDVIPTNEVDSYIEALYYDEQPKSGHNEAAPLPITLDFGALSKQSLPGTTVPLTRTEIDKYVVQPGDTCWSIADMFGVSVSTILWANNLNNYCVIRPGKELTILPTSGVSHTVREGDTLASIAKKYGATAEKIMEQNNFDEKSKLAIGNTIVIPGGRPYVAPKPIAQRRAVVVDTKPSTAVTGSACVWPTKSKRITQYFGWRHTGLDIGDDVGAPIYACADGVIETAGWGAGGWGNTVVIDHGNGLKTRYSHATKILVGPGQSVSRGDVIALVGSTGRSTGPHVDMRIYVSGRSINPLEYLK